MPAPLPGHKRAAILNDIRAGGTCRGIAREHDVSASTVTKIARENNLNFERAQTEKATRAKQVDNRSRRVALASRALDDADAMRNRALGAETGRDARDFATAYGIFIDKHAVLERLDASAGAETVGSLLGSLLEEMTGRHGTAPE